MGNCGENGPIPLSFIKRLLNLTRLDVSDNELDWEIHSKRLEINIKELLLLHMRMYSFTVEIGHMTKLRYQDISSVMGCTKRSSMEMLNVTACDVVFQDS